jgi:uncharacterized protein DUF4129
MRERTGAGTRLALVGLGVCALLAIVALASRGGLGGGSIGGPSPSGSLLDYAFSIFLVAYVLAIPFVIYALWFQRRTKAQTERKKGAWLANVFTFLAFLVIALALERLRHSHGFGGRHLTTPPTIGSSTAGTTTGRQGAEPAFQWLVAAVTAALVLAGAVAWYWARRRRGGLREPLPVGEELALALDDALDEVRAETDPRRAVIKAYARMEQILGAYGLPRASAEAPLEYLARTLGLLHASAGSVARLTDLFERAKFSRHEIGPELREEAILALTAVRDELRSPVEAAAA